jgi:hypothetical protein
MPSYYTASSITLQLSSLSFVRSYFHYISLLLSRSTCYAHTIPSIPRSCNNVLYTLTTTSSSSHHTTFTYSLAVPKLQIQCHLGPTTAQTQIAWVLATAARFWVALYRTPYFLFFGDRGLCPLLPNFMAAPARNHAEGLLEAGGWGFHKNFFLGPPHLHNVVGRPPKFKRHLFLAYALMCKIW